MPRNTNVEKAVERAIGRLDAFIAGKKLALPPPNARRGADAALEHASASVRVACFFFSFYALVDARWDCDSVPTGTRGQFGDKLLAESMNKRSITLHNRITAFAENLGWKGNVTEARLTGDKRFKAFSSMLQKADAKTRVLVADYMAARFAESRREQQALPPVAADVLTFARAKLLLRRLIALPTLGHIQQFVVAALLTVHRKRHQIVVKTHHPHGSDKSDETAGDIEEFYEDRLIRAYEVTVRPDWKNRVSNFERKMDRYGLRKYVIIAGDVNRDEELADPERLIKFLEDYERDIAIVDILDLTHVFAAELTADELREAVNLGYEFLARPDLSGRPDYLEMYRKVVNKWLDEQTPTMDSQPGT